MFDPPIDDAPSLDKLVNDIMDLQRENAALKAEVASLRSAQQPQGKICADTVESCEPCDYCTTDKLTCRYVYCKSKCYVCFTGRKLSPVR